MQLLLWGALCVAGAAAQADPPTNDAIGQYLDADGDGKCDSVLVRFQTPLKGPYRFRFTLCGSTWETTPALMEIDSSHRVYSFRSMEIPPQAGSKICTEVDGTRDVLRLVDTTNDSVVGTYPMLDRMAPFIASARLHQSRGPGVDDTVEVETSEPIQYDPTGGSPLLRAAAGNPGIPVTFRTFLLSSQTRILFFIDSASNFLPTDSIRLSPWSIQDMYGNEPGSNQKLTPVSGTYPTSGVKIRRFRGKPSGRPDRDALGRPRPAGTKPKALDGFWLPDVRFTP